MCVRVVYLYNCAQYLNRYIRCVCVYTRNNIWMWKRFIKWNHTVSWYCDAVKFIRRKIKSKHISYIDDINHKILIVLLFFYCWFHFHYICYNCLSLSMTHTLYEKLWSVRKGRLTNLQRRSRGYYRLFFSFL